MQRQLIRFAGNGGMTGAYRVEVRPVAEAGEWESSQRSLWDKCLGIATMVVVSVGGWAAIIELIRLLR